MLGKEDVDEIDDESSEGDEEDDDDVFDEEVRIATSFADYSTMYEDDETDE